MSSDMLTWYDELRQQYRPTNLKVLLIAESPPDSDANNRRFFYAPELSRFDNLYRGVVKALYGYETINEYDKTKVLERLRDDGYWLIDAVESPINNLGKPARRRAIKEGIPGLVTRCQKLAPEHGVIICHSVVYKFSAARLIDGGVSILQNGPLRFPLGNWRADFVHGMRQALGIVG
ncbi:MAG TPA: hypothetical protein VGE45_21510 [Chloroflexia bacterium]|jgi:hypothetical protein